ncbi:MAG: cysteine synthase A [Elusimicrobiaceae bacterium]|nr:cysteine synthase A [Elusimicrobiaceae bacterium]
MNKNIIKTIGNTPLVQTAYKNVFAKLEYFNPSGSVKDRAAFNILNNALKKKKINKNTLIIEATSGNMGISLAFCASALGLNFCAVMPENMTIERRKLMLAYGAKIILTPASEGMKGSVLKAESLAKEYQKKGKKVFIVNQFDNIYNVLAHTQTAKEILKDTNNKVGAVFAGIGSGGTITGVGKYLKKLNPKIKIIGVEPKESPLLTKGIAGPHKIQGIGANFVPKNLDFKVIDKVVDVSSKDAYTEAREAAKEGLFVGISSGAVLKAAKDYAKKNKTTLIVAILADGGARYLSGDLFDENI